MADEEELKSQLMKVRGEWKSWPKAQHSENEGDGIQSHHFMGNRWGNSGNSSWLYFSGLQKSLQMVIVTMKLKDAYSLEGVMTNLDSVLKSRDITLSTKAHLVRAMVFPVVMYGCESWTVKMLSTKELMVLNCGIGEDSWESLGLQGDPTSPS